MKKKLTYNQNIPFVTKVIKKHFDTGLKSATEAVLSVRPGLTRESAASTATRVLSSVKAQEIIRQELEERGITDELLDKRLKHWIVQNKTPPTSLNAIIEGNKLKGRYPKEQTEHRHLHLHLNQSEVDAKLAEIDQELAKLS